MNNRTCLFWCLTLILCLGAPAMSGGQAVAEEPATETPTPEGMVLIPAGQFQMGSDNAAADDDEQPVHTVYLDAFYMDVYEVTNAQFKAFVDANPQWQKNKIDARFHDGDYLRDWDGNDYPAGKADHPVTFVSWYAAMAYAAWAGKRLPTEAEWEYAARGGLAGQTYPWGNTISAADVNYDRHVGNPIGVGNYPPNGYGLYDIAGNVWEWCLDKYDADFYRASLNSRHPVSVSGGRPLSWLLENFKHLREERVLRGGSWNNFAQFMRVANRNGFAPTNAIDRVGFRCVRETVMPAVEPTEPAEEEPGAAMPTSEGMVRIPTGQFQMCSNDEDAHDDEQPVHTVYLDAFFMDKYEVTNAQFKVFVDANPQWQKDKIEDKFHDGTYLYHWDGTNYPAGKADHPVTFVSWYAAMAYAQWAGKRLPTEAEWEYAARGGLAGKKYPWGNTITPADANYNCNVNVGDTTPIGRYAANGYGLYDMAGNVWEWCLDKYDADFYRASLNSQNPVSVSDGHPLAWLLENFKHLRGWRVVRGGSSNTYGAQNMRVTFRGGARVVRDFSRDNDDTLSLRITFRGHGEGPPTSTNSCTGFRCVRGTVTPYPYRYPYPF